MKKAETLDINVLSPLPRTFNESRVNLNFTLNKAVNWTAYSLDGTDNVTFAGNLTLTGLANDLHNITLYANTGADDICTSEPIFLNILVPENYFPAPVAVASIILIGTLSELVCIGILHNFRKHKRQRTQQHQQSYSI